MIRLNSQRVLEVERHFDEKTAGETRGTPMYEFSMFGRSFGAGYAAGGRSSVSSSVHAAAIQGMSDVHLAVATTTGQDLTGDALFALFETRDEHGAADPLRVTALCNGTVLEWIPALVEQMAHRFGLDTHFGVAIQNYAPRLASHFGTAVVSYLSVRLHPAFAQDKRCEQMPVISVGGVQARAGRGAIVATSASIGGSDQLRIFPTAFPAMWGDAVGGALAASSSAKQVAA